MAANGTKCSTNEECASGICLDEVCTDQSDPRYKLKKQTDKLNKYRQNITDNENLRDRLQEELNYLLNRARQLIPEHSRNEANIQETHREMRRVNTELRDLEEFRRNNPDIDKDEEGNNIYERDNALSYRLEFLRYEYPRMVDHRNKLVNEYNDMIDKLIPEREELITKIQERLRKRKEKLRRISKEISDDSDVRKRANVEIKLRPKKLTIISLPFTYKSFVFERKSIDELSNILPLEYSIKSTFIFFVDSIIS